MTMRRSCLNVLSMIFTLGDETETNVDAVYNQSENLFHTVTL